jgi:hypothetical protein
MDVPRQQSESLTRRGPIKNGRSRIFACPMSVGSIVRIGIPERAELSLLLHLRFDRPQADAESIARIRVVRTSKT